MNSEPSKRRNHRKTIAKSVVADTESELGRQPSLEEIENALLGGILLDPACFEDVLMQNIRPDDLHSFPNRIIFGHLLKMRDDSQNIDCLLLKKSLEESGEHYVVDDAYIAGLMSAVQSASHTVGYAKILREHGILQRLSITTLRLMSETNELNAVVESLIRRVDDGSINIDHSARHLPLVSAKDIIDQYHFDVQTRCLGGIKTGFTEFDNLTFGGFHLNEVVNLVGPKGIGKTSANSEVPHAPIQSVPCLRQSTRYSSSVHSECIQ
jgi:replicative DNA helicase